MLPWWEVRWDHQVNDSESGSLKKTIVEVSEFTVNTLSRDGVFEHKFVVSFSCSNFPKCVCLPRLRGPERKRTAAFMCGL